MIYEVEGGGVGTGETVVGAQLPVPWSVCASMGTLQSHLKTLSNSNSTHMKGGTMEGLSAFITQITSESQWSTVIRSKITQIEFHIQA
jgi:hypothetical protein